MPPTQARERAETIRQQITLSPIDWKGTCLSLSASLGGTTVVPGESAEQVFERADQHLYEAKKAGRDRVVRDP